MMKIPHRHYNIDDADVLAQGEKILRHLITWKEVFQRRYGAVITEAWVDDLVAQLKRASDLLANTPPPNKRSIPAATVKDSDESRRRAAERTTTLNRIWHKLDLLEDYAESLFGVYSATAAQFRLYRGPQDMPRE